MSITIERLFQNFPTSRFKAHHANTFALKKESEKWYPAQTGPPADVTRTTAQLTRFDRLIFLFGKSHASHADN